VYAKAVAEPKIDRREAALSGSGSTAGSVFFVVLSLVVS